MDMVDCCSVVYGQWLGDFVYHLALCNICIHFEVFLRASGLSRERKQRFSFYFSFFVPWVNNPCGNVKVYGFDIRRLYDLKSARSQLWILKSL